MIFQCGDPLVDDGVKGLTDFASHQIFTSCVTIRTWRTAHGVSTHISADAVSWTWLAPRAPSYGTCKWYTRTCWTTYTIFASLLAVAEVARWTSLAASTAEVLPQWVTSWTPSTWYDYIRSAHWQWVAWRSHTFHLDEFTVFASWAWESLFLNDNKRSSEYTQIVWLAVYWWDDHVL